MVSWSVALDLIEDARGSVAMFMFIIEEAVQTMGMACYLAWKERDYQRVLEIANYALNELINPAIDFTNTFGHVAVPLELAYDAFFKASKKNFENYIEMARKKLGEG